MEKKEQYKIYEEKINIKKKQIQEEDYIGKRFNRKRIIQNRNIYREKT